MRISMLPFGAFKNRNLAEQSAYSRYPRPLALRFGFCCTIDIAPARTRQWAVGQPVTALSPTFARISLGTKKDIGLCLQN
jgi:hypothetical protein